MHDQQQADTEAARRIREGLLANLRAQVKAARFTTYSDIASSSGNSTGWVGEVLRGNYPHRGACYLPKRIADALARSGFKVPPEIATFGGGQEQDKPDAEAWLAEHGEALAALPHPDAWRAKQGDTLWSYLRWMLDHAGQEKRIAALEKARSALAEATATG